MTWSKDEIDLSFTPLFTPFLNPNVNLRLDFSHLFIQNCLCNIKFALHMTIFEEEEFESKTIKFSL